MEIRKRQLTVDEVSDLIYYNQKIQNAHVSGIWDMGPRQFDHVIKIENCDIDNLVGSGVEFLEKVQFINCHFRHCNFARTFFVQGLEISNCIFDDYLDFQCGGHNTAQHRVCIEHSVFKAFVSFFDCWYSGPVIIYGNDFQKGTNIFGNRNESFETTFDYAPIVDKNKGRLDVNGEGL